MMKNRLTVEAILEYLGIPRSTWDKWRRRGVGPPMMRLPNGALWIYESNFVTWLEMGGAS